jgi:hypothetical protein
MTRPKTVLNDAINPTLPFHKDIRINGDQFQTTADVYREHAAKLLRLAAINESLAIEAWAKAEAINNKRSLP